MLVEARSASGSKFSPPSSTGHFTGTSSNLSGRNHRQRRQKWYGVQSRNSRERGSRTGPTNGRSCISTCWCHRSSNRSSDAHYREWEHQLLTSAR